MEAVIIKLSTEHYKTKKDMERLLKYIAAKGSNGQRETLLKNGGKGVSSSPAKAAKQMQAVQRAYGKESKRRMYHLIVSFPENMKEETAITDAAANIANMLFENYQVFYGIHAATDNWHIHFAINAVNYKTGKKWHQTKKELTIMKKLISNIAEGIFLSN